MAPNINDKTAKKPASGARRFVPDTRKLTGYDAKEPPTWAVVVMVGIVGFVILLANLSEWGVRIPYANSDYFWVGMIALPMVALLIVAAASKLYDLRRAASWTPTTGKVVLSKLDTERHRFGNDPETVKNVPAVEYEFTAGGRTVRGSRIGIGDDTGGENTEATLARYPLGKVVTVYYDPADPKSCVLEREGPKGVTARGCLGALAALLLFGGAAWWLVTRGPAFVRAHFPKAGNPEFAAFAAGFGLLALMFFIAMHRALQAALRWPSVKGAVRKSEVEQYQEQMKSSGSSSRTTTMYRAAVEYAYTVDGHEFHSTQIKLMMVESGSKTAAEQVTAKYPRGSTVTVHYDPANPGSAALENPTGMAWYPLVLALGCFALAAWQAGVFK